MAIALEEHDDETWYETEYAVAGMFIEARDHVFVSPVDNRIYNQDHNFGFLCFTIGEAVNDARPGDRVKIKSIYKTQFEWQIARARWKDLHGD